MLVSQAHSLTRQARLAITLAWVAGYTNAVALLTCGLAVSHMTGAVATLGKHALHAHLLPAALTLALLAAFLLGAVASAALTELGRRRGWDSIYVLPVTVEAALLLAVALSLELAPDAWEGPASLWIATPCAAAMGLQNATITRISGGVVRTTHLTGVLTDLGAEFVHLLLSVRDRATPSTPAPSTTPTPARPLMHAVKVNPSARRLALLVSIVGAFALGAALGTLAHDLGARVSMVPPVALLLWIVFQDTRTPICTIRQAGILGPFHPFGTVALYRLEHDPRRKGRVQRLPDLPRWWARLPASHTRVVLDLHSADLLDDNAALELRALALAARADGKTLVLAGFTPAQYARALRAGAGDALTLASTCPDLDLAIARAAIALPPTPEAR